jgi:hypothetical protein
VLTLIVSLFFIAKPSVSKASSKEWHKISFSVYQIDEYHSMDYFDALIGKEIVIPTLRKYQDEIKIFFFKRTAKRNNEHRFVFCFLAKKKYANRIFYNILDHWIIQNLEQRNLIDIKFHVTEKEGIAGLSNPSWDQKTREHWPYQMQRESKIWLTDLCQISEEIDYSDYNLHELLDYYKEVSRRVDRLQKRKTKKPFQNKNQFNRNEKK